jgi:hypothetical protein
MKNFGSGSVDRIAATKESKLLTMLPRALRLLLLFSAFAPRRERRRKSLHKTVADQQLPPLPVTKADPLDDASNVIEGVDGIPIVDQPRHLQGINGPVTDLPLAVFKISRTRPPLGLQANED